MTRTIWRTKIHPANPTTTAPVFNPVVIAVDLDGSQDISVWFEHDVADDAHPAATLDELETRLGAQAVRLTLHAVPTGGEVPAGTKHVGSVTHPALVRHVYAETTVVPKG